jgi:hypothetical protein
MPLEISLTKLASPDGATPFFLMHVVPNFLCIATEVWTGPSRRQRSDRTRAAEGSIVTGGHTITEVHGESFE